MNFIIYFSLHINDLPIAFYDVLIIFQHSNHVSFIASESKNEILIIFWMKNIIEMFCHSHGLRVLFFL
jgi:hypothetical protein